MPSSLFPSHETQFFSAFVHFFGAAILTHCLSRRVASERLTSLRHLVNMPLARVILLLVFVDSWMFVFSSSMVVFGVGLERTVKACEVASYLCTSFYATSKFLIYSFLVEKMHIVWQPIGARTRLKSPLYLLCAGSAIGYVTLFILLLVARWPSYIDEHGICRIGIKSFVTWSIFAFDLYINILLTSLFVIPLWRYHCKANHILRTATQRALVAATVSLSVSTANILALTLMHGQQQGWLCLSTCTPDIIVNALAVFWATTSPHQPTVPTEVVTVAIPEFARPKRDAVTTTRFTVGDNNDLTRSAVQIMTTTDVRVDVSVQLPSDSRSEIGLDEEDIGTLKPTIKSDPDLPV